jgi:hypothetical protein
MDAEGNYVVNMTTSYEKLAEARREAYKASLLTEMGTTIASLNDPDYIFSEIYGRKPSEGKTSLLVKIKKLDELE